MNSTSPHPSTRGVLFVHSAPSALLPHIEWAAAGVLGGKPDFAWVKQPAEPGTYRAELSWQAPAGTSATLASALRGWEQLRFEVSEEPTASSEGARYSACALSFVLHAHSPLVPTLRGDARVFVVGDDEWYGGGLDLTPSYVEADDCEHFHASLSALCGTHGEVLIPEDRIKAFRAKAATGDIDIESALDGLLGLAWDNELEAFRHAGEGAPVRWLHQVV